MLVGCSVLRARPFPARTEMAVAVVVRGGTHVLSMAPVQGADQAVIVARSPPTVATSDCIALTLHPATPPIGDEENARAIPSSAPPDRVIVLNCFGRGGSGIVWRMIGSSPDVIMTSKEWHVGVFGERKALRKGVPLAFRSLGIRSAKPLQRYAYGRTLDTQRPKDVTAKSDARSLVVKLMDYHIVFGHMIAGSFPLFNVRQSRATPLRPVRELDTKRLDSRARLPLVPRRRGDDAGPRSARDRPAVMRRAASSLAQSIAATIFTPRSVYGKPKSRRFELEV